MLIAIVVPALYRGRATLVQAPEDERFAPDLRIITEQSYSSCLENTEYRCTIYPMERVMETKKTSARNTRSREHTINVRMAARTRSRAKAQIAARTALRQRFLAGGVAFAAVAVITWILVFTLKISIVIPAVVSTILVAYLAGFVYLLRMWKILDRQDRKKLDEAQEVLSSVKHSRPRAGKRTRPRRSQPQTVRAEQHSRSTFGSSSHIDVPDVRADSAKSADPRVRAAKKNSSPSSPSLRKQPSKTPRHPQTSTKPSDQPATTAIKKISVPKYTLKPTEKSSKQATPVRGPLIIPERLEEKTASTNAPSLSVKEVPSADEVNVAVPYRPQHVGERIGEEAPEPPYTQTEMTAQASGGRTAPDTRRDVLGVGATLDSLLDRRRA